MIRSFRHRGLEKLWNSNKALDFKTLDTQRILDCLDVVNSVGAPQDAAFTGFRYDEWMEGKDKRYGIMVSDH